MPARLSLKYSKTDARRVDFFVPPAYKYFTLRGSRASKKENSDGSDPHFHQSSSERYKKFRNLEKTEK